jgi:hypothetical protein
MKGGAASAALFYSEMIAGALEPSEERLNTNSSGNTASVAISSSL